MGVIDIAQSLQHEHNLDIVWVQVGFFLEAYDEPARQMSRAYNLQIWQRDGVDVVGVPITHQEKWRKNCVDIGLSVGVAVQVLVNGKIQRVLGTGTSIGDFKGFSDSGNSEYLGEAANLTHELRSNEIFSFATPGIFSPTVSYKKICDSSTCSHVSDFVSCLPVKDVKAQLLLGRRTGYKSILKIIEGEILGIYPDSW
jgi:DNA mismatch repair ATPase MutS